jgi:hypothetical protein
VCAAAAQDVAVTPLQIFLPLPLLLLLLLLLLLQMTVCSCTACLSCGWFRRQAALHAAQQRLHGTMRASCWSQHGARRCVYISSKTT